MLETDKNVASFPFSSYAKFFQARMTRKFVNRSKLFCTILKDSLSMLSRVLEMNYYVVKCNTEIAKCNTAD